MIDINGSVSEYLKLSEQIKVLEAKKKEKNAEILKYLKDIGQSKILCEGIGEAQIVTTHRDVPQAKVIEEKYGIVLTPDCFKHSDSEFVKVQSSKYLVENSKT